MDIYIIKHKKSMKRNFLDVFLAKNIKKMLTLNFFKCYLILFFLNAFILIGGNIIGYKSIDFHTRFPGSI